jgi:hypothetical protein
MTINEKKTVCMRIGPRYQNCCAKLTTASKKELEWVSQAGYLGIYILSSAKFKCCYDNAKKSFYRSFNAVYGRLGKNVSEEVILSLIRSKCLPVLPYGLDACPLIASDRRSLNFTLTRTLMKIFGTTSNEIISECQTFFVFPNAYVHVNKRKCNFLRRYAVSENLICRLFHVDAERELLDCSMNNY